MNAKEFIASKGNITDPDIRFLNAGEVRIIPLEDLLDEYLVQAPATEVSKAAAEVQAAKPQKVPAKTKKKKT